LKGGGQLHGKPYYQQTGGWLVFRGGLIALNKKKISYPSRTLNRNFSVVTTTFMLTAILEANTITRKKKNIWDFPNKMIRFKFCWFGIQFLNCRRGRISRNDESCQWTSAIRVGRISDIMQNVQARFSVYLIKQHGMKSKQEWNYKYTQFTAIGAVVWPIHVLAAFSLTRDAQIFHNHWKTNLNSQSACVTVLEIRKFSASTGN
jgi:hypothetical protein